jgi:hypothetical protein
MTTIRSNLQHPTTAVPRRAAPNHRRLQQTTITGETHIPLLTTHHQRRLPRPNEHQNAFHRNNRNTLVQATLQGEDLVAKDSGAFGDVFPPQPGKNCTIITFQNIGSQRYSLHHPTSTATSRAFKDSQAGIALYAECSLVEMLLPAGNGFNDRMRVKSPNSYSSLTNDTNEHDTTSWHQKNSFGMPPLPKQRNKHCVDPTMQIHAIGTTSCIP